VLDLIGVEHGPTDPLHELGREVLGLEIASGDPLAKHYRTMLVVSRCGRDDDLRHSRLLWSVGFGIRVPPESSGAVKDR
jgi:hypothetical protein